MHFTRGTWLPPFEAKSALLQVASGCTHNCCKFCSLYDVNFRISPIEEMTDDLRELQYFMPYAERVFLTGANPMVMSFEQLENLLILIHEYLPNIKTIGGFAQVTDIASKSISELRQLHFLGLDGIHIGTETGDDDVLLYMNKRNTAGQTIKECKKLELAEIKYHVTYLTGLAGSKKDEENAIESAKVFNMLRPQSICLMELTIFPESELYKEILTGNYIPACEFEKLFELKTLIEHLNTSTVIYASTISNNAPFAGVLPRDKQKILKMLDYVIANADEYNLLDFQNYNNHL